MIKQIYYNLLLILALVNIKFVFAVSLEENSPFIPYDYVSGQSEQALPSQQSIIELRGILDFGDEPKFSLYNTRTQKSVWVKLNDRRAPYLIDSYNPDEKVVAITLNGVRQQLEISKPAEESSRGPARVAPPPRPNVRTNPVPGQDEEEDDEEEDGEDGDEEEDGEEEDVQNLSEEEQAQRRKEMSERVYRAFQQYVSERRGE